MEDKKNKTFRSVAKWGDPSVEENLSESVLKFLQNSFSLNSGEANKIYFPGLENISIKKRSRLEAGTAAKFRTIVGNGNIKICDKLERARHASGKSFSDILKIRQGIIDTPPDAVIYPRNEREVIKIIEICNAHKIPIIAFGGGTSVTGGATPVLGGVSLDLSRMKKIIRINIHNSSATVEPGIKGPELEKELNKNGFTCGHFPQSFEFSTVGGWVAARGAGQASTGYGKIEDIVLGLRIATPRGLIIIDDYPARATGPDLLQFIIGSEGVFGVITEVTLKIRKYDPNNTKRIAYIFKDFVPAVLATQEIMQGRFGKPFVFRLTDPKETETVFKSKDKSGTFLDKIIQFLGYMPDRRCIMIATIEGDRDYANLVAKKMGKITRRHGALPIGSGKVKDWEKKRFKSAYLRDPLIDHGYVIDTLETSVNWDNLISLWQSVRKFVKAYPDKIILLSHLSHCYENGANLYFIFLLRMSPGEEIASYLKLRNCILNVIRTNNGSLSHHHNPGKDLGPWMHGQVGEVGLGVMQVVKDYLDPGGIMNPGRTLGLKP